MSAKYLQRAEFVKNTLSDINDMMPILTLADEKGVEILVTPAIPFGYGGRYVYNADDGHGMVGISPRISRRKQVSGGAHELRHFWQDELIECFRNDNILLNAEDTHVLNRIIEGDAHAFQELIDPQIDAVLPLGLMGHLSRAFRHAAPPNASREEILQNGFQAFQSGKTVKYYDQFTLNAFQEKMAAIVHNQLIQGNKAPPEFISLTEAFNRQGLTQIMGAGLGNGFAYLGAADVDTFVESVRRLIPKKMRQKCREAMATF